VSPSDRATAIVLGTEDGRFAITFSFEPAAAAADAAAGAAYFFSLALATSRICFCRFVDPTLDGKNQIGGG